MTRHNGPLNHQRNIQHAANVNQAVRSSNNTMHIDTTYTWNPADAALLRGIPAVGSRGSLGGAITGTRPDTLGWVDTRTKKPRSRNQ